MALAFFRASTSDDFEAGQLDGVIPGVDGAPTLSGAVVEGTWTSGWVRPGFDLGDIVPSWNADTPPGSHLDVELQAVSHVGFETPWYSLGRWAHDDAGIRRASVPGQADELGSVAVDVFHAAALPQGTAGHLVVLTGITDGGDAVANDPAAPSNDEVRRVYDRGQFERAWLEGSGGIVDGSRRRGRRSLPLGATGELSAHDQRRPHPAGAVVGERAPERVTAGAQAPVELPHSAGMDDADAERPRAADTAESEIMVVLAEVGQLDDRVAVADLRAREREGELVRHDLEAGRISRGRCRSARPEWERECRTDRDREGVSHRRIAGRWNFRAPGMIASASVPSQSSSSAA